MLVWREYHHVEGSLLDRILERSSPFPGEAPQIVGSFHAHGLLEAGTPVELIFGFAVFTALNSLFCAIEIINHRFTAFAEILIDSLFDLCAAVLFPIVVLVYSANNFDFDRAVFHINMELLPVGSLKDEHRCSPVQQKLNSSASPLILSESAQWRIFLTHRDESRVFLSLQAGDRGAHTDAESETATPILEKSILGTAIFQFVEILKVSKWSAVMSTYGSEISCHPVPCYSVGVIVVTHRSISTSQAVCSSYPECAVFAYRWRDTGLCPCLALIDGNRAPKTYFEWTHPLTLQILSLINCAVEKLPIWAKGFRKLQYLQIEGKVGSDNLGNLADDLFSDMPDLRYLQLGLHQRMVRLPPLDENITSSGYTRIADQSPMTSVACPWACPSAPTLLSDCGISSTSSSSLYLAAETRRRRRLQAENDTETCSDVAVVDATSLSGLGVQAAELTNTTLTELNLTDNNIADVRDLQLPETLQQLYLSRNKLTSLEIPESWRHLEVLNVSDNPIANFTAEGKDGPRVLIARNTSLSSMEDVVFPATLRQLDVSLTPIANWGNFTPPTDLSDLFSTFTCSGLIFWVVLTSLLCASRFLNGSSVTQFEVCKSDVKVLERLEAFDVTTLTLADDSCSDATIPTSVIIANTSYSLCVLTDAAFDEKYKGGKVSSSTSLTTLLLLLFSIASAVLVLLMLFAIKRKIIDERRAKAARAEKLKAEHAASEGSSDDEESDKMKMSSAMLTDDVRSDPDFERYRIPQNDLEVVKQLAKGAGGVVHLAKWKPKNEQVVVKRVAPEKSKSVRELQRFTREIRLYGSLKHPKIVAFRGIAWSSLADLSLVLEYMPNGDLAQFLERQQMLDSQRRGAHNASRPEGTEHFAQ
ncbi:Leucine-rich repeat domain, L domain-like [Phytophthora cactorum]|nr:Leucine-rich repeat domain, L domain-like [Phytophthora cactorum]